MITIVLADDHQVVRKGLKALLSAEGDFNVIGEAGNGAEALDIVMRLQPDILVLDLMMPRLNSFEVIRQIEKKCVKTRVVILSMHSNKAYYLEALRSGAKAYVLKESPAEELVYAIREAVAGRKYLSSSLAESVIEAYTKEKDVSSNTSYNSLTSREKEIFQLVVQGYSNFQIAAFLFISTRTVETHRTNLMRKLGIHNHAQLIQFAMQRGLISPTGMQ
jgi:two-component system response regulator NreC